MMQSTSGEVTVVGSGMTGSTAARVLADQGYRVTVIDRRPVVSGNMYDPVLESGHRIHQYGPHVFHTNIEEVYSFLNRFTEWDSYEHKTVANIHSQIVPVPFNYNSMKKLLPNAEAIIQHLSSKYEDNEHVPVLKLLKSDDEIERRVAEYAYKNIFETYTKKQWDLYPDEISPSVTARVPIRMGYDDRYFTDKYQGLPADGYLSMIQKMLDHENIEVRVGENVSIDDLASVERVLFTGPVDELLGYKFGVLPYRSLTFEYEEHKIEYLLPTAQLNFTVSKEFTRIVDYSRLLRQGKCTTITAKEYSHPFTPGVNEAFYPVPNEEPRQMYRQYSDYLSENYPNILLAGRLADYKYYNMDQSCKRGLLAATEVMNSYVL